MYIQRSILQSTWSPPSLRIIPFMHATPHGLGAVCNFGHVIAQIASSRWLVNPLCRPPCCTMHQPKENHMAETNRGRAVPLLSCKTINRNKHDQTQATC